MSFSFIRCQELLPSWTSVSKTRFALDSSDLVAPKCFDVNRQLLRLKWSPLSDFTLSSWHRGEKGQQKVTVQYVVHGLACV